MNGATGGEDLAIVDLLLGEGSPSAQHELRARIDTDPLLALEVAETVAVLERFRELRAAPSQRGAARLADVVRRAERRVGPPPVAAWRCVVAAGVAAVATFTLLWSLTPTDRRPAPVVAQAVAELAPAIEPGPAQPPQTADAADPFEVVRRRLEHESPRLREALAAAAAPPSDPIARWLDPHNSVALMRLDHELRRSAEERERRQRTQGGMPGSEQRLQELASAVARQLPAQLAGLPLAAQLEAPSSTSGMWRDVALAVRSLLAVGLGDDQRQLAVATGSAWLARRLDRCHGDVLVIGLLPLLELAAMRGDHAEVVRAHGQRLVDAVVADDGEAWRRHRPQLLGPSVACEVLGEAGRLLRLLPAFGVADRSCRVVRHLLLAELHDRRERGADGPEVLAATLFGFVDLLPDDERAAIERQLRRWKPSLLAPDFDTLLQMAWGMEPGRVGVSSWRRGLRMLAVRQDPQDLGARAGLCLCLASCYGPPTHLAH